MCVPAILLSCQKLSLMMEHDFWLFPEIKSALKGRKEWMLVVCSHIAPSELQAEALV
jgi:hypothetical protein